MPYLKTVNRDVESTVVRIEVLLRTFASQSIMITKILRDARIFDSWGVSVYDERLLPKLTNDVILRPENAYFAHVLVPHSPLIYRDDCSIDYSSKSWMRCSSYAGLVGNSTASRKARYSKMVTQIRCALNLLKTVFDTLRKNGLFDKATIIVHGDHGSSAHIYSPSVYNLNFIEPGKPTQNAYIESFNGKLRQECLRQHWFQSLNEAREIVEDWRQDYNHVRPHSSLKYRTPKEVVREHQMMKNLSLTSHWACVR